MQTLKETAQSGIVALEVLSLHHAAEGILEIFF